MNGSKICARTSIKVLGPHVAIVLCVLFPFAQYLPNTSQIHVFPALIPSQLIHKERGQHSSGRAPHEIPRWIYNVRFNCAKNFVSQSIVRGEAPSNEKNSDITHQIGER